MRSSGSDIRRVVFSPFLSGATTALNTETSAPWQCNLNSRNFADGNYTLRAVAYDSSNRSATATRAITIKNNTQQHLTRSRRGLHRPGEQRHGRRGHHLPGQRQGRQGLSRCSSSSTAR